MTAFVVHIVCITCTGGAVHLANDALQDSQNQKSEEMNDKTFTHENADHIK